MAHIIITQQIPENAHEMFKKAGHRVEVLSKDGPLPHAELKKKVAGADAIVSVLTDKIDGELMDSAGKKLKIIANYAVGFDNIDVKEAKKRAIVVTNTPGVLTESVAEHSVALMFAVAKRIVESDTFVREGKYKHWMPNGFTSSESEKNGLGQQLWGKTIGIVGLGRIGSMLAEICYRGLRMRVLYHDMKHDERLEMELGAEYHLLPTLLERADVVSINVPLMPTTRHLISGKELLLMKKTAILINTSRGPVVDEKALVSALKNGEIAGAGLDVFENEPNLAEGLKDLPNVVLTPHTASATLEARTQMATIVAENVIQVLAGKPAINPVNLPTDS